MVGSAVAICFWSRSNNLKIASLIVLTDWLLSNYFFQKFGQAAVNYIAPMNILFFGAFLVLARAKSMRGQSYYRRLLVLYFMYLVVNLWHLGARDFAPGAFVASYWYVLLAQNIIFVFIILMLCILGFIKGRGNRTKGGVMAIYYKWAEKVSDFHEKRRSFARDWRERVSNFKHYYWASADTDESSEKTEPKSFWLCFKKYILKRPADSAVEATDESVAAPEEEKRRSQGK